MLVEIHVLQNHAPSNLNRDDTGSPKDCMFGGVRRARISSQCLKRSIRRSPLFAQALEDIPLAVRTRQLPNEVKQMLLERGVEEALAEVAASKASGFGNKDGKEQKEPVTAQMMLLAPSDIEAVANVLYDAAMKAGSVKAFKAIEAKALQADAELRGWRPITPDIALFGRMITSNAFKDVQAASQVAHAISTHKMEHEFDYFTAVDDLLEPSEEEDKGAGMIGDVEFNSACYYKYFSIDVGGLVDNMAGPKPSGAASSDERATYESRLAAAQAAARRAILGFLEAAVFTTPSGKQNSFAAHQLPDGVLVEVRSRKTPVSYANAFVKPAVPRNGRDLVDQSLHQFKEHVELMTHKFGLTSDARYWFTTRDCTIAGASPCDTFQDLTKALDRQLDGQL